MSSKFFSNKNDNKQSQVKQGKNINKNTKRKGINVNMKKTGRGK